MVALDKDGLFGDSALGSRDTSVSGDFAISYPPGAYGLEANPDIVLRVHDLAGRVLTQTPVREDVNQPTLDAGTIVLRRDLATGFATTLGTAGTPLVSDGNDVELLVDNEDAWAALTDAIRTAESTIHMGQLYIDVVPVSPTPEQHGPRIVTEFLTLVPQTVGTRPEDELVKASWRGAWVRLLLNDFRWLYGLPILGRLQFPKGLDPDVRDYSIVAPMLRALGVTSVRLLTGNPEKARAIAKCGIEVREVLPLTVATSPEAVQAVQAVSFAERAF